MERVHVIFKDPHTYGYPVYWKFSIPDNTHHMVLLLQVIPSYFSTFPISERTDFILYPAYFLLEALTYHRNILVKFINTPTTH